jgi:hypothetical protein
MQSCKYVPNLKAALQLRSKSLYKNEMRIIGPLWLILNALTNFDVQHLRCTVRCRYVKQFFNYDKTTYTTSM